MQYLITSIETALSKCLNVKDERVDTNFRKKKQTKIITV